MGNPPTETAVAAPPRRRPLFLLGFLFFLLGPGVAYALVRLGHFGVPWYMPILATVGVLLMAVSARRRRGFWRVAGLVLFVALCGFEWYFFLIATRTPVYTGPAQPGRKVPAFSTRLADGQPFTDKDLATGGPAILLFFRGRW